MDGFKKRGAGFGVAAALVLGAGGLVGCGEADDPLTEAENTIEGTAHDEHHGHDHGHEGHGHAGQDAAEKIKDAAGEAQEETMEMLNGATE